MTEDRLFYGTPDGPAEIGETRERKDERPLSEMDFSTHIFSLKLAALSHLDGGSSEDREAREAAQHLIDTLLILRTKTKGNLSKEEARFLSETIALLQQRFVQVWG